MLKPLCGFQKGYTPWNKGKKCPNISRAHKGTKKPWAGKKTGQEAPNWKDGRCKNKEFISWQKNQRNRNKRKNGGSHTFGEWEILKTQYNWTCPSCYKSEPEIKLTEDHIVPISKGGSDNIENIQPLCRKCNGRKHSKIIKFKLF